MSPNVPSVCVLLGLLACGGGAPAPASSPPPSPSSSASAPGATEAQAPSGDPELSSFEKSLARLGARIDAAGDSVKAGLQRDLAGLKTREEELKAELKDVEKDTSARADHARRDIRAAMDQLQQDMKKLADRIAK